MCYPIPSADAHPFVRADAESRALTLLLHVCRRSVRSLATLSPVGIPPMAGFFGKLLLFGAALDAGYAWLAVVAILNSVLSLAVYLRIIVPMYRPSRHATPAHRFPAVVWGIALVLMLAIGLAAEPFTNALGA